MRIIDTLFVGTPDEYDDAIVYAGALWWKRVMDHESTSVNRHPITLDTAARRPPPSKRLPSKLHPLVQLDEAIGRDMTKGDE